MPCTCRHTSSRASAIGRNRSHPMSRPRGPRRKSSDFSEELHAMDYLVYAYLQLGQDDKAKARRRRDEERHRLQRDLHSRAVRAGRVAGALRSGARRLEGGGGARSPTKPARPCAGDHLFRPRARRRALGRSGSRQGRYRQARRAARQASRGQGRLLVRAGRYPDAGSRPPGCSTPKASTTMR